DSDRKDELKMKRLFALIHSIIIGTLVITGNDIYDWLLGGIIAVLGFVYAFQLTRIIAEYVDYYGLFMSLFHWTIRTIIVSIIIILTREIYYILVIGTNNEITTIIIITSILIVIAESLKYATSLRKKYW